MIRYLIWDAGGTLFDTYPALVEACRQALRSLGHAAPPQEEILSLCRKSTDYGIRALADQTGLDHALLAARFTAAYEAVAPRAQPLFPGARELCAYIVEQGGSNYIVTHRSLASLEQLLQAHAMLPYFAGWITKDDPLPRKPDPASILALLQRYALDAGSCLAIGDRCLDLEAGRAAGVATCLFGDEPCAVRPDIRVRDLTELLQALALANEGTP